MDADRGETEVIDAVRAATAPPAYRPAIARLRSTPWLAQARRGHQVLRLPQDKMREGERIDAHVQEGPAAQRRVQGPIGGRAFHDETQIRVHLARRPETTRLEVGQHRPDHRIAGHPHGFHQEQSVLSGESDHLLGFGGVERQCLLAQDRLAGLEGEPGVLQVHRVRAGDVDDVDGRIGHEVGVRRVCPRLRLGVLVGKGLCAFQRPGTYRGDPCAGRRPQVGGEAPWRSCRSQGCPSRCGPRSSSRDWWSSLSRPSSCRDSN